MLRSASPQLTLLMGTQAGHALTGRPSICRAASKFNHKKSTDKLENTKTENFGIGDLNALMAKPEPT